MAITKLIADSLGTGVGGKVLQVVNTEFQTSFTTTSTSATDTGIALSITPSSTNSRILLETNIPQRTEQNVYVSFYIYRQINSGGYSELDRLDQSNHYYLNNIFCYSVPFSGVFRARKWC